MPLQMPAFALAAAACLALTTAPAMAAAPFMKTDDSWISLSGQVVSTSKDSFKLDYGQGLITVEMDEWDWYNESGERLRPGEHVTVYGEVDDDLYETRTIEASSVYASDRNIYYYASPADEEAREGQPPPSQDFTTFPKVSAEGGFVTVSGTVLEVQGREMRLDLGGTQLTVDTSSMAYNPVDGFGHQQVQAGDVVRVSGKIAKEFFENKELVADTVTSVRAERRKSS